ncbi:hypothetical protein QBC47DRAFT_394399 [Echria macrotheca]|uniref:Uncharacterized protein n=1 Tax=Echria macrotheca TaxID=438768 RepID=A0AAJ0F4E8_9PEZI|nr:hypothetical protein QBC47DRAFT_394399 [Echria macrotheca]
MLKQFANMQQLFLWLTALAVSPPRYLVGVTWWVLRLLYRAAWRRAPVWAQTRLKAPPDTRESPPAFWPAYRRPSAALILGVLTTAMVVFTFLAGEAVRRERNIWRAHNSWHWAYARNQGWVPRHPSLVPFEADYKLAVEPLLDRIVDVVHMFMFVGGYGQPDRPGERFVKWLLMEQV